MLRRLLVVGLAGACFGVPTAHAGTIAIFYYPWYGTPSHDGGWQHWNQNGHLPPGDVYSRFFPAGGPYSSSDPSVVDRQMTEIASAGINEVVVSWWGRGSAEDRRLPLVLATARRHALRVGIHVEPYDGRSPATVAADLAYLSGLGVPHDVKVYDGVGHSFWNKEGAPGWAQRLPMTAGYGEEQAEDAKHERDRDDAGDEQTVAPQRRPDLLQVDLIRALGLIKEFGPQERSVAGHHRQ